jgi:hypothetical protein
MNLPKNDLLSKKAGLNYFATENSGSNGNKKCQWRTEENWIKKKPRQRRGSFTKLSLYINTLD